MGKTSPNFGKSRVTWANGKGLVEKAQPFDDNHKDSMTWAAPKALNVGYDASKGNPNDHDLDEDDHKARVPKLDLLKPNPNHVAHNGNDKGRNRDKARR
ncbi:hypothetical protein P7C71_g3961, partial [Lecanoromycetidae sp. Uapishka_2]